MTGGATGDGGAGGSAGTPMMSSGGSGNGGASNGGASSGGKGNGGASSGGKGNGGASSGGSGSGGQGAGGKPAMQFAKLPYRGLSLAGAEFAANTNGGFNGNTYGTIPGFYYYPDKDWPDEGKYPGGYGKVAFPFFRGRGMNTFRLPFRWERLQRSLNADFNAAEFTDLKQTVADMEASGAFVLLDVHNYARYASAAEIAAGQVADKIGSTAVPNSAFADLWRRLADQYKSDENVLFGLMNEPWGLDSATQWFNAANAAVAAIRGTGAKNLILIGGNEWSDAESWPQVSDSLKGITDSANNFAFEIHVYPDDSGAGAGNACSDVNAATNRMQPFTDWARSHKFKGFLGEFSAGIDVNADASCMTAVDNMLSYLEKNSDVYIGWTYWAGGQGWGENNPMEYSVIHNTNSKQMDALVPHLK
jgi:endoglucanase